MFTSTVSRLLHILIPYHYTNSKKCLSILDYSFLIHLTLVSYPK